MEVHESSIPWLKIFTAEPKKEMTDCSEEVQTALWKASLAIEKAMREYYNPEKINIASFGNYLPHVHVHVMARFKEDSHFPEPMWGQQQREGKLELPPMEGFFKKVKKTLAG